MVPAGTRCKGRPDVVSSLVKYSTESHRPSPKAMAVSQMWFYISIYVSIKIRPWWLKNRGPTTPPSPTSKPPPSTSPNLPPTHTFNPPAIPLPSMLIRPAFCARVIPTLASLSRPRSVMPLRSKIFNSAFSKQQKVNPPHRRANGQLQD